uniref:hypothetical protein n=1 Tax=uncultured Sphingomonas sp. TaxID=158754 RepID=UPI0035CBBB63
MEAKRLLSGVSAAALLTIAQSANKAYANTRFDQAGPGFAIAHYGEPRTFGLSAGYKF